MIQVIRMVTVSVIIPVESMFFLKKEKNDAYIKHVH